MEQTSAVEIHNQRVVEQLEQMTQQMAQWSQQEAYSLKITDPVRHAVDRAYRKVICGRKYLVLRHHTEGQRRFLRMMLTLALATDSGLQSQAVRVARYLSRNYVFEWCTSPITAPGRGTARDMILRAADAQFDETPYAPQLAYVMFHHQELGIINVSDYTELYTRALTLDNEGFFRDGAQGRRQELGLHRHPDIRESKRKLIG